MLRTALPKVVTELPGPKTKPILEKRISEIPASQKPVYPLAIARGEGAMFEDMDGNVFLDWVGGVGVLNIGYSRPELIQAVKDQADKFFHQIMLIATHQPYVDLAEKINQIMPVRGDHKKTSFSNSGAEAIENALRVARAFTGKTNIISMTGAYHGRTAMTLALTAKTGYYKGYGPLPAGVQRCEFPYLYRAPGNMTEDEAIDYYIGKFREMFKGFTDKDDTAAVIFEGIQGEGGFIPAPIKWVQGVREICDEMGILMIVDEVQCGWAQSGRLFVSELFKEAGAAPDIIATAKSIAGGLPLAAVTARDEIMDSAPLGGTFGGNPLSCAAALQVVDIMQKEDFPAKARHIGEITMPRFNEMKEKYEVIGDVRGRGAFVGIEFVKDKKTKERNPEIVKKVIANALKRGLLLADAGLYDNNIRLLAPLCMTDEQIEIGLKIFEESLVEALEEK